MSLLPQMPIPKDHTPPGRNDPRNQYPNKIFSLAEHYIPKTPKELFHFCQYYFTFNPVLHHAIIKGAEYPITDILIDTQDKTLKESYEEIFNNQFKIRYNLLNIGINYHTFGNAFVSVMMIKNRMTECPNCRHRTHLKTKMRERDTRWDNFRIVGPCRKCGGAWGPRLTHKLIDVGGRHARFLRLTNWSPFHLDIDHNPITGENVYYYNIPKETAERIRRGNPDMLCHTPLVFIQAVEQGKRVRLNDKNLFHFAHPGIITENHGWGRPVPVSAMQELYYRGILRRGQEALALDHVVPMRYLFPDTQTGAFPTHQTVNMGQWAKRVEGQITKMKKDPNHIALFPFQIGSGFIGGHGRGLFTTGETQVTDQNIIAATQMTPDTIWGGGSWSGSSVSLRMLENHFKTYRDLLEDFLTFIARYIATILGWGTCEVRLSEFKMADDQVRRDFLLRLNMATKVSDETLLGEIDLDHEIEAQRVRAELKANSDTLELASRAQAIAQAAGQSIMAQAQQEAMMGMQPPPEAGGPPQEGGQQQGDPQGGGQQQQGQPGQQPPPQGGGQPPQGGGQAPFDPQVIAQLHAHSMMNDDPANINRTIEMLYAYSPQYAQMLHQVLNSMQQSQPLPESRPPRRGAGSAMI